MEEGQADLATVQFFDLTTDDGLQLQAYHWQPPTTQRGNVILVHGLGEHARRYAHVASALNEAGFAVFAYDQRGHGQGATSLGDFGEAGWPGMLDDLKTLVTRVRQEQPGPVFVLGHSMGAMLTHHFMTRYSELVDGVVLSGSPGFTEAMQIRILLFVVRLERLRRGRNGTSPLIHTILFGSANKQFAAEGTTGFEWLSRDAAEVQKYVNDPLCGTTPTCGSTLSWFSNYRRALTKKALATIRKDLPVYLFSGTDDPVHNHLKNIERQLQAYAQAGLTIERKFYARGRHEMFNEPNRDTVIADLIAWLNRQLGEST